MKISTIVITYNEERNIARCLESVKDISDEIIVVDSYSTDRTVEIAESFGAKVYKNTFEGYIEQKNYALKKVEFEYVLSLDADEALDSNLQEKLKDIIQNGITHDGYVLNRLTNFCGQWIRYSGWYPDKKLRFFKKEDAVFGGRNPHDQVLLPEGAALAYLKGDILHYSFNTISEHVHQINRFSSIGAVTAASKNRKTLFLLHIIGNPIFTFVKKYFLQLGFLDGYYGFIIAFNTAYSKFLKYVKLRELNQSKEI